MLSNWPVGYCSFSSQCGQQLRGSPLLDAGAHSGEGYGLTAVQSSRLLTYPVPYYYAGHPVAALSAMHLQLSMAQLLPYPPDVYTDALEEALLLHAATSLLREQGHGTLPPAMGQGKFWSQTAERFS